MSEKYRLPLQDFLQGFFIERKYRNKHNFVQREMNFKKEIMI
jgi:hypothetical protein